MWAELIENYNKNTVVPDKTLPELIESLPLQPKGWQKQLLAALLEIQTNMGKDSVHVEIIQGAYAIGKTVFLCFFTLAHFYQFGHLNSKETYRGTIVSGSEAQLKSVIINELSRLLNGSLFRDYFFINNQGIYSKLNKQNNISFRVMNERNQDSFAGTHAETLLTIFDEASAISQEAFDIARSHHSCGRGLWLVAGNPTNTACEFYAQSLLRDRTISRIARRDFYSLPDQYTDEIRERDGEDSDAWRVKVLGEFPLNDAGSAFPAYVLRDAKLRGKLLQLYDKEPVNIGIDFAKGGSSCDNVIVVRSHMAVVQIFVTSETLGAFATTAAMIIRQFPVVNVGLDACGCGLNMDHFIKMELHKLRYKKTVFFHPVISNAKAIQNQNCSNIKTELAVRAVQWLDQGGSFTPMPEVDRLVKELTMFAFDPKSPRLRLEPKKDIMDVADAFLYSFVGCDLKSL